MQDTYSEEEEYSSYEQYPSDYEERDQHGLAESHLQLHQQGIQEGRTHSHLERSQYSNSYVSSTSRSDYTSSQKSDHPVSIQAPSEISILREKLRKIFTFYASFGSRCHSDYLKPSQFIKMMVDAGVQDGTISQRKLDLVFIKHSRTKKQLKLNNFMELLFEIGQLKYYKGKPSHVQSPDTPNSELKNQAFLSLLQRHIVPLFEVIYNETEMGLEDRILNTKISLSTILVLKMTIKPFKAVYSFYFKNEVSKMINDKPSKTKLEKELFKFLRDFEICPQLITKGLAYNFLTEVLQSKKKDLSKNSNFPDLGVVWGSDIGKNFTFFRFLIYLCRLALYIFSEDDGIKNIGNFGGETDQSERRETHTEDNGRLILPEDKNKTGKTSGGKLTPEEKVYLLLERIDISAGLKKVSVAQHSKANAPKLLLQLKREDLKDIHGETGVYPHFFNQKNGNSDLEAFSSRLGEDRQLVSSGRRGAFQELGPKVLQQNMARRSRTPNRNRNNSYRNKENRNGANKVERASRRGGPKSKSRSGKSPRPQKSKKNSTKNAPDFKLEKSFDIFDHFLEDLHKIFEYYTTFGEHDNYTYLSITKFVKMLYQLQIIRPNTKSHHHTNMRHEDQYGYYNSEFDAHDREGGNEELLSQAEAEILFKKLLCGGKGDHHQHHHHHGNVMYHQENQDPFRRRRGSTASSSRSSFSSLKDKTSIKRGFKFPKFLEALEALALETSQGGNDQRPEIQVLQFIRNQVVYQFKNLETLKDVYGAISESGGGAVTFRCSDYFTLKLVSLLKSEEMINILGAAHSSLIPIYKFYADDDGLLTDHNFKRLMKDFEVFPSLISNAKLSQIFHELSQLLAAKDEKRMLIQSRRLQDPNEAGFLDSHLFAESLALISQENPNYNTLEMQEYQKFILLLEAMNKSDGVKTISRSEGRTISQKFDIFKIIRKKYPDYLLF